MKQYKQDYKFVFDNMMLSKHTVIQLLVTLRLSNHCLSKGYMKKLLIKSMNNLLFSVLYWTRNQNGAPEPCEDAGVLQGRTRGNAVHDRMACGESVTIHAHSTVLSLLQGSFHRFSIRLCVNKDSLYTVLYIRYRLA